jgi:hypothetical protein
MLAPWRRTNVVQDVVDFSLDWLRERRYATTIDVDMARWADAMGNAPSIALVNPTFDPRWNRLSPDNSFWIDIRLGSHTIAMIAQRLFVIDDYLELKRSLRLWYRVPPADRRPLRLTVPADLPVISGNVGHEGGMWIHPDHRKRGLSTILPHLARALAFRQWQLDWQTGLALKGVGASGLVSRAYGMPHVVPCFEGIWPVSGRPDRLYLAYMNRGELLAGLDLQRIAPLLPDRHAQPGHAIALVKEG